MGQDPTTFEAWSGPIYCTISYFSGKSLKFLLGLPDVRF